MPRFCTFALAAVLALTIAHSAEAAKKKSGGKSPETTQQVPDTSPSSATAGGEVGKERVKSGPTSAEYFGVQTHARRVCYIVDNSNSMTRGRFDTACHELMKSVNKLDSGQEFYVTFFSDTAYPLFYPNSAKTWVPANSQNKYRLKAWLKTVQLCLHTKAKDSLARALAMKPDVIYLLTDGAFTDGTLPFLLSQPKGKVTIHALGMQVTKGNASDGLRQIAAHFGGTYAPVDTLPQFRNVSRPKNTSRNGIWGLTLGNGKEGKKEGKKHKR